jgi:hypothetical protein
MRNESYPWWWLSCSSVRCKLTPGRGVAVVDGARLGIGRARLNRQQQDLHLLDVYATS